jgi:hypothetical protein
MVKYLNFHNSCFSLKIVFNVNGKALVDLVGIYMVPIYLFIYLSGGGTSSTNNG